MTRQERFVELFRVPPAMRPYVELIVEPREMDLILAMDGQTRSVEEVAALLHLEPTAAREFLERCYRRHVVDRDVDGHRVGYIFDRVDQTGKQVRYTPNRFYHRLDHLTMYDNWDDLPPEVRREVSAWWLDEYAAKIAPVVENIKKDPDAYQLIKQKDFLLLDEALAQVEAAQVHAVLNCDCRSAEQACSHMREGCIRLDDGARYTLERGLGRALTREECVEVVLNTDRDGLMHIGTRQAPGRRLFGFCNCCTCCCYPLRASQRLESQRVYPRVHYVARRDEAKCIHCGLCARRCQFQAFAADGARVEIKGKSRQHIGLDPARCFGCGLCATACPTGAITMTPLDQA